MELPQLVHRKSCACLATFCGLGALSGALLCLLPLGFGPPSCESGAAECLAVLGSSVALGSGASSLEKGWAQLLAKAVRPYSVSVVNHARGGTTVDAWQEILRGPFAEEVRNFDSAIMALSLGNEGLAEAQDEEKVRSLERHYLQGLRAITRTLRSSMRPGSRIILGGPYPHGHYKHMHLEALLRVRSEMFTWEEVDYVIDFLCPGVLGTHGTWARGIGHDPGHPNTEGHARMFACVDVPEVLGPSAARGSGQELASGALHP